MKWEVELIRAKHCMWTEENGMRKMLAETAYLDPQTEVLVPLRSDSFKAIDFLNMEEQTDRDEGVLLIDTKTSKMGLLVR
jgi:hypothetical protein